jgi:hypothetical protein
MSYYGRAQWKAFLQTHGQWESFVLRRDELKESGLSPRKSYEQAKAEFTQSMGSTHPTAQFPQEVDSPSASDCDSPASESDVAEEWQPPRQLLPAMARREDFTRFEAPADEVVRWVAANMWLMDVKAKDAPCPEAWYLLWQCRVDPGSRTEFWRGTYPRLLTKNEAQRDDWRDDNIALNKLVDAVSEGMDLVRSAAEEAHSLPVADAAEQLFDPALDDDEPEGPN